MQVKLICGVRLPPRPDQSVVAEVKRDSPKPSSPLPLEADFGFQKKRCVQIVDALVPSRNDGATSIVLTNCLGWMQRLEVGTEVGPLQAVEVVELAEELSSGYQVLVKEVEQK